LYTIIFFRKYFKQYEKLDNKNNFTATKRRLCSFAIPHESAISRKLTVGRDQFWPKTSDYNNRTEQNKSNKRTTPTTGIECRQEQQALSMTATSSIFNKIKKKKNRNRRKL